MKTIYLPDDKVFEFHENEHSTAREVIAKICQEQYKIENPSYYGIFSLFIICQYQNEGDEHETKLQLPLKSDHKLNDVEASVQKIYRKKPKIHFKFGRTAFYPIEKEEKIQDEKVLKILYLEAKNNVFDKLYPLSLEQKERALKIDNSINAINSDSSEDDLKQKYHSLSNENKLRKRIPRIKSFRNSISLNRKKIPQNPDENGKTRSDGIDLKKLYQDYLSVCRELPCYGGLFFEGQMERTIKEFIIHGCVYDKKVAVAINDNGIHVIQRECPKILLTRGFKNLDYKILYAKNLEQEHNCLIIREHDDDPDKPTKKVFTRQASFIDQTLKTFVRNHRQESVN